MPLYDKYCPTCGTVSEYFTSMSESANVPDCSCGGKCVKTITTPPMVYGDLNDFSTENGGKGRFNKQLNEYVTSVADSNRKAKARGWSVLDKAPM